MALNEGNAALSNDKYPGPLTHVTNDGACDA
jgi:hypothetical protein